MIRHPFRIVRSTLVLVMLWIPSAIVAQEARIEAIQSEPGKAAKTDPRESKDTSLKLPKKLQGAPPELRELRARALGDDLVLREKALAKLLKRVTPGTKRKTLELWLGKGTDEYSEGRIGGDPKRIVVTYYCRPDDKPGSDLMTVHYQRRGEVLTVVEVRGPHTPDD